MDVGMCRSVADHSGVLLICEAESCLDLMQDQGDFRHRCCLCLLASFLHHTMGLRIHADTMVGYSTSSFYY